MIGMRLICGLLISFSCAGLAGAQGSPNAWLSSPAANRIKTDAPAPHAGAQALPAAFAPKEAAANQDPADELLSAIKTIGDAGDVERDAENAIAAAMAEGSTRIYLNRNAPLRVSRWREAAAAGGAAANWLLGCCYEHGIAVGAADDEQAFRHYLAAAEGDYGPALNDVGLCYKSGKGVSKNLERAAEFFARAADHDRPGAWYNLGTFFLEGIGGLPRDRDRARECFERAAELGYDPARRALRDEF